ncbi:MAG TPA: glycosyltransferase family 87 protein [Gemmatimonadaceae bacterium]|nr:glycosyltransferase family 87 protein [Gemmatimonadaceae bacterium]
MAVERTGVRGRGWVAAGHACRRMLRAFFGYEATWVGVYLLVAAIATGICVGRRCNNFLIFRAAYSHLLSQRILYLPYPREHADLFKYSPTFALLFAPFARMPFAVALFAWNLLNVLAIYVALRLLMPRAQRLEAIQLAGIGLVTTVDGTQSNGLVAALIVLAFVALERDRIAAAASAIAAGALVKLFPLSACAFALPRRDRGRFAVFGIAIGAALVALPLLVTPAGVLVEQYRAWWSMGAADAADRGASIMRILHVTTGYDGPNWPIQAAGAALLVLPVLLRPARWAEPEFRRGFLASVLVFSVIFNHKAEQPSFIIALSGIAIWYASQPRSPARSVLTGAAFVASVPIFMTVVAPGLLATSIDRPLLGASCCCAAAWLTMQGELLDLFPERDARSAREFVTVSDEPAV